MDAKVLLKLTCVAFQVMISAVEASTVMSICIIWIISTILICVITKKLLIF